MVPSATPPTFQADCAWAGAQCAVLHSSSNSDGTAGQYFNHPTVNLGALSADAGFSICVWFVFDEFTTWARIFDFGNGAGMNNVGLARGDFNRLAFFFYCDQGSEVVMLGPIVVGEWRHMCIVNKGTSWKLYNNGMLAVSHTSNCYLSNVNTIKNYLGRSNWNSDKLLYGKVDEFRLYNGKLSATDVAVVFGYRG